MESRTEFNIEQAVDQWKGELKQSLLFTKGNLWELESHLYDEIDRLQELGLSDEEAFVLAKHHLGTKDELINEYGKNNQELRLVNRLLPFLKGLVFFAIFNIGLRGFTSNFDFVLGYYAVDETQAELIYKLCLGGFGSGILGLVYTVYKKPQAKILKLAQLQYLIPIGLIMSFGSKYSMYYLMKLHIEKYNVASTSYPLFMTSYTFEYVCYGLVVLWSVWAIVKEKKLNKVVVKTA